MKIRRITIRLPARMRATAVSDGRAIACEVARTLAGRDDVPAQIGTRLAGGGQSGAVLARSVADALRAAPAPKAKRVGQDDQGEE